MQITDIRGQARNQDRVSVYIDGKYRLSLDIKQVVDLGIKKNQEIDQARLDQLLEESDFGKLYVRALEYSLLRPRSMRELRDYLVKKTYDRPVRSRTTGQVSIRKGFTKSLVDRVLDRIVERGYVDDEKFTRWWVENRNLRKGTSQRKLVQELRGKGVSASIIEQALSETGRSDQDELRKIVDKKINRYQGDMLKFKQYLSRHGFSYSDIVQAIDEANQAGSS